MPTKSSTKGKVKSPKSQRKDRAAKPDADHDQLTTVKIPRVNPLPSMLDAVVNAVTKTDDSASNLSDEQSSVSDQVARVSTPPSANSVTQASVDEDMSDASSDSSKSTSSMTYKSVLMKSVIAKRLMLELKRTKAQLAIARADKCKLKKLSNQVLRVIVPVSRLLPSST